MRTWEPARVARAAGAELSRSPEGEVGPGEGGSAGPPPAAVDSRRISGGELFVGIAGEREDGGAHAAAALARGAWGVLVTPERARELTARAGETVPGGPGVVLAHPDPLAGLQALAAAWAAELRSQGARTVAITGSTGKTSTKDILAALLSPTLATVATSANLNTEIGLPLTILAAPPGTRCLVLEMAMRGPGQIAQLCAIAQPQIGVIVNIGPAHLELLGSLEAIAAAKAELIAGLPAGGVAVIPAGEPLLEEHLRADLRTITFGPGGEVSLRRADPGGRVEIAADGQTVELEPSFDQPHNILNLLAAVAVARALGVEPGGPLEVAFSERRGQRIELGDGIVVIDDCYNANPMSMRAAIENLSRTAPGRRVAVLGDMLELGPEGPELHRAIGALAGELGVELLVAVGPLAGEIAEAFPGESVRAADASAAAALLGGLLQDGDTVLLKGSRGVGLERVLAGLRDARTPAGERR